NEQTTVGAEAQAGHLVEVAAQLQQFRARGRGEDQDPRVGAAQREQGVVGRETGALYVALELELPEQLAGFRVGDFQLRDVYLADLREGDVPAEVGAEGRHLKGSEAMFAHDHAVPPALQGPSAVLGLLQEQDGELPRITARSGDRRSACERMTGGGTCFQVPE